MNRMRPLAGILIVLAVCMPVSAQSADSPVVRVKSQLEDVSNIQLQQNADGSHVYIITRDDGSQEQLTPSQFARRLYQEQIKRSFVYRLMNVSSPMGMAWVGFGLLGQLIFTCRMIVQWLVSEKNKRSIVPVAFWWLSLGGASILMTYFIWRQDIVGILGQGTGWLIYTRNLYFIYGKHSVEDAQSV